MSGEILVLDDEENYAEMLQGLLKQNRFRVDMATKPELALEALEEKPYQLVISDYKMPIMDGAVFLKKAREIYPDLPVILVSGLMNTPELVKVANMGVTLVLEKPLDTEVFLDQVKRFVSPMTEEEENAEEQENVSEMLQFTYPSDLAYLVDVSAISRRWIQQLWDLFQSAQHIFVSGPEGSEFELVLREISRWKGMDGLKNHYFSAGQLDSEHIRRQLAEMTADPDVSRAVAIGDLTGTTTEQQEFLVRFLQKETPTPASGEPFTFVYWIDEADLEGERSRHLNPDMAREIRSNLVSLPPLSERLPEIAVYTVQHLGQFAREAGHQEAPELSGEAMHLLLQYPWPGNYAQLVQALKQLTKVLTRGPVPVDALRTILQRLDGDRGSSLQIHSLEELLIARQQSILHETARRTEREPVELLRLLNFDVSVLPAGVGIDALDLLYPELLEE
ncbi:MAG: response regulator [Opitutales bacterium]